MALDRKEFLQTALSVVGLGFVASRFVGCGGSDGPAGTTGAAGTGNASGGNACEQHVPSETISANHGHVLTVTQGDVAVGTLKIYDIQGTATHDHMVTLSPGSFSTLEAGQTVTLTSTTNAGHSHTVTVACV
jgi:hypothetical protein